MPRDNLGKPGLYHSCLAPFNYAGDVYGIELKSFTDDAGYKEALKQAATYGAQLGLTSREIYLVIFVESIDDDNRKIYETAYKDPGTGVTVKPVFISIGAV